MANLRQGAAVTKCPYPRCLAVVRPSRFNSVTPVSIRSGKAVVPRATARGHATGAGAFADPFGQFRLGARAARRLKPAQPLGQGGGGGIAQRAILAFLQPNAVAAAHLGKL